MSTRSCFKPLSSTNFPTEQLLEASDEEVLPEGEEASSLEDYDTEDSGEQLAPDKKPEKTHDVKKTLHGSDEEEHGALDKDEDVEGWGSSRKDYYDADVIETEADALEEEAEAKRLQQKQLQDMTEADFGFDEKEWLEAGKDVEGAGDEDGVRREVLPKVEITDAMGPEEKSQIMQKRYPEFEPLAREFLDLQSVYENLTNAAMEAASMTSFAQLKEAPTRRSSMDLPVSEPFAVLKHRSLGVYLGSLSMYFALLTSGNQFPDGKALAMPPEVLQEHAIMDTLVQCRDLWERIKDIPLSDLPPQVENTDVIFDQRENGFKTDTFSSQYASNAQPSESSQLASNEQLTKHQKKRIRKAERLTLAAQAEANAKQQERLRQAELSLQSLPDFTRASARMVASTAQKAMQKSEDDDNSDFGDPTSLTAYEAAEKAKRKKSLKFYTSQIAQKSNKRDGAGRDAGGDADLPYRERLKDRQERLRVEAERRGRKAKTSTVGAPLGEGSSDEEVEQANAQRKQNGNASDSDGEYYDHIVKRASDKKASKAANATAQADVLNTSFAVGPNNDYLDADGKRGITYAIEKNKGLHPHRKKEVRNPRVKKRKKFEEKKKKLKSVRAVYNKEREGKGGYGGEKTGIKRSLVRSVKL